MTILRTIGYQGASLDAFLAALRRDGVTLLIDVREAPHSRKKGFSKTPLAEALAGAGIDYVHLRALGTPKEGRDAAHAGDRATFERIFRTHLATDAAQAELARALELAEAGSACLMCYERDPAECHRSIVAEAMEARAPIETRHLFVDGQGRLL